jgi:IS30 family transposase
MRQQIIEYFKEGLGDKEIASQLGLTRYQVGQEVKRLGLVRDKDVLRNIKRRCSNKMKAKYRKQGTLPKDVKNYITDNIRKGLIHSGDLKEDLEADIEIAVLSIQKLREAKRKKTERNEVVVCETL